MDQSAAHVVLAGSVSSGDGGKDDAAAAPSRAVPGASDDLFIGADVDGRITGDAGPGDPPTSG